MYGGKVTVPFDAQNLKEGASTKRPSASGAVH
jgi:hypothetical protein